jgi:LPPG:FO 2-phospho-L-lactate transferase
VILAGGTGGAKLARGLLDLVGERLVVIANTGDDVDIYGARVCPDPDLVTFHLADRIDPRGWGLLDDTFAAMEQLEELGAERWFNLGDRDLAIGLERKRRLDLGDRLTDTLESLTLAFGVEATVLPMCDSKVSTFVHARGQRRPFQEFMILDRAEGPVEAVEFEGIESATPPPEALAAIEAAEVIVIGPSNPAISIDPILAVPGMTEAIVASPARVVAVCPLVDGNAIKGPTEEFLRSAGIDASPEGIASHYSQIADVLVADASAESLPTHVCNVLMDGLGGQVRLAAEVLGAAQ